MGLVIGLGLIIDINRSKSTKPPTLPIGVQVVVIDYCEYLRHYDNKFMVHKGNCTNCITVKLQGNQQKD